MLDRSVISKLAIGAGAFRAASGASFIVAPQAANRLWGGGDESGTAALLLRSMGYRDALIGSLLLAAGVRDDHMMANWFLASAGADAADLLGGLTNRAELTEGQDRIGNVGAAVGIAIGVGGAVAAIVSRRRPSG